MSKVTYNGIELKLAKTNLSRDAVYSPDGTDYLYTKFILDVTAVYNPQATAYTSNQGVPVATPGTMPQVTDQAIRHALMQPRKSLVYSNEVGQILASPPVGASIDCLNGPNPVSCAVRQVVGSKTWIVTWRCVTHLTECFGVPSNGDTGILSNRFTVTDRVDEQQLTTRITAGAAIFRMDRLTLTAQGIADAFRNQIVMPVPAGFRRLNMEFSVNTIGNMITYTVTDRQQLYSLGGPRTVNGGILEFKAVQGQSTVPIGESGFPAPYVMMNLNVRVIGAPDCSKQVLAAFAVKLAIERLALKVGPANPELGDSMLRRVQIAENLDDRIVDLLVEVQVNVAKSAPVGLAGLQLQFIGADVINLLANDGNAPTMANDNQTRGTFTSKLTPQLIQDACQSLFLPSPTDSENADPAYNYGEATATIVNSALQDLTTTENRISDPGAGTTDYKIHSRFETEEHKAQMPTTAPPGNGSSDGGSYGGGGPFGYGGSPGSTEGGDDSADNSGGDSPPTAEILTLANPTTKLVIDWTAERIGLPPRLPHPELSDQNYVLMSKHILPGAVIPGPDLATPVYRVSGTYHYAALRPLDISKPIGLSIVPWSDFGFGEFAILPEAWQHGITDESEGLIA